MRGEKMKPEKTDNNKKMRSDCFKFLAVVCVLVIIGFTVGPRIVDNSNTTNPGNKWTRMGDFERDSLLASYAYYELETPDLKFAEIEGQVAKSRFSWEELGLNREKADKCRKEAHLRNAKKLVGYITKALPGDNIDLLDNLYQEAVMKSKIKGEEVKALQKEYRAAWLEFENRKSEQRRIQAQNRGDEIKGIISSFCSSEECQSKKDSG